MEQKIIYLHGYTETAEMWKDMDVSNNYTDQFAHLDINQYFYDVDSIPLVAESILNDLQNIDFLLLVGHSMGGYIALEIAKQAPNKIDGIMLLNSNAMADTEEKKEQRNHAINMIDGYGKDAYLEKTVPPLYLPEVPQDVIGSKIKQAETIEAASLKNQLAAMRDREDNSEFFKDFSKLKSSYIGKKDPLINYEDSLNYYANFDEIVLYLDNDSGHMSTVENPEKVKESLINFFGIAKKSYAK